MTARAISRRSFAALVFFLAVVFSLPLAGLIIGSQSLLATGQAVTADSQPCTCEFMGATMSGSISVWISAGLSAGLISWLIFSLGRVSREMARAGRRLKKHRIALDQRTSELVQRLGLTGAVVMTRQPQREVVTAGLWRPRIVISRVLVRRLNTGELTAVLAHEQEHWRRRDPMRLFIVAVAETAFGFIPVVRNLVRQFRQAIELAADASSVDRLGSPLPISRALTRLMGWRLSQKTRVVASFRPGPDRLTALISQSHDLHASFFLPQLAALLIIPVALLALVFGLAPEAQANSETGQSTCRSRVDLRIVPMTPSERASEHYHSGPGHACQSR